MSLFHEARQPALDADGNPISGATWSFYLAGTTTPATVYSNSSLSTSLGTSVTANAAGRFTSIFFDDDVSYRAILRDAGGSTLDDVDPANPADQSLPGQISALDTRLDAAESDIARIGGVQGTENQRTIPTAYATLLAGCKIYDSKGYGPGAVQHNIDIAYLFRSKFSSVMGSEGDWNFDVFVDWANGNDTTGTGYQRAPYKTVGKAAERAGVGTIWVMSDSNEQIILDGAENTVGGGAAPRALRIKQFNPAVPVKFISAGDQPSAMTWTETSTGSKVWKATPSGGQTAEFLLFSNGGNTLDAREIQFIGAAANEAAALVLLSANLEGWTQVTGGGAIYIRYADMDVSANKSKFTIRYAANPHQFNGIPVYLEDILFEGGGGIDLGDSPTNSAFHTNFYMKGGGVYFQAGEGVSPDGHSTCMLQNVSIKRNAYDGIGPYGNSVAGAIDCTVTRNGSRRCRLGVTNLNRNRQAMSTHDDAGEFSIGCDYRGNYGQNVADTGSGTTWLLGCDCRDPEAPYDTASITGYPAIETYSTAYIDSCAGGGKATTYGLTVASGMAYLFRNRFDGTTGATTGTTSAFNPFV